MTDQKLSLAEVGAGGVCLDCVETYVEGITACVDCGRPLATAADLRRRLAESAPTFDRSALGEVVLVRVEAEDSATDIRAVLVETGRPFIDHTGPDGNAAIFVLDEDVKTVSQAAARLDGATSVLVCANDEGEAVLIRAVLDEAGIAYAEEQFSPQYGLHIGAFAGVRFLVCDADMKDAKQALAASSFNESGRSELSKGPGTSVPRPESGAERWAIVALCTDLLQARSLGEWLAAHGVISRRETYDLYFGGPVVKIYVPDALAEEALRLVLGAPTTAGSDPVSAEAKMASGLLAIDWVFTKLGLWLARRCDPAFKKEQEALKAAVNRLRIKSYMSPV